MGLIPTLKCYDYMVFLLSVLTSYDGDLYDGILIVLYIKDNEGRVQIFDP